MIGKTISHYRVLEKLGSGGMGVVYKAEDTKLGRTIALKVLPPERVADPNRRRRFIQEARAASALNHPNIITIHDIDEAEGVHFIAMEYVAGKTLDRLMAGHGLRVNEALKYAVQMAAALAKAHSAGIVHRDLKPTNVMVTDDGLVKVLDFGLAKLTEAVPTGEAETVASVGPVTEEGTIVGTVGYMSPEQAEGKPVDARSDIFSFGSVLYEMLTSQRAFRGETKASTIAAILREEPKPLSQVVEGLPRELERLVRRCLRKDAAHRFQHMDDLKVALEELKEESDSGELAEAAGAGLVPAQRGRARGAAVRRWAPALAGAVTLLAAAILAYWLTRPLPPPRITRTVQLTNTGHPKYPLLVTDGLRVYFSEDVAGRAVLQQVSAAGGEPTPVPTPAENIWIWDISPDGAELFVDTSVTAGPYPLRIMPTLGGSPRRVGSALAQAASWGPHPRGIVYANGKDLYVASRDGSDSRKLVAASGQIGWPRWSPDGKRLRFTVEEYEPPSTTLWEVSADGTNPHRLLPGWNNPPDECCGNWTADGEYFVFQARREGQSNLWAIREKSSLLRKAAREPVQLTHGPLDFWGPVPSKDGKRLFAGGTQRRGELVRYDARAQRFVPYLSGMSAEWVDFSRDGTWVLYTTFPEGSLWRSKADGSERLQLTFPPLQVLTPRWSPDGKRIVFMGQRPGETWKAYVVSAEGGAPQRLIPGGGEEADPQWSPDGNRVLFGGFILGLTAGKPLALHLLELKTNQVSTLPGSEGLRSPRWSPDGRYVAAFGQNTTTLVLFDFDTQKWEQLAGGAPGFDNWSKDGKYVYYWNFSEGAKGVYRVGIRDHKVERVASLEESRFTGNGGPYLGLAPDDSPLVLRDTSIEEIYALDWEAP
jgi:Tol biopolymer transport system component/predicted Ser/Thr protein kinase